MRLVVALVVMVVVALATLVAWPLFDLYRIAESVRSRDETAFHDHVDLTAVRTSLAAQFIAEANAGAIKGIAADLDPAGQAIATNLIAARLEALITPDLVFELLRRGRLDDPADGGGAGAGDGPSPLALPADPLSRLKGLGFVLPPTLRLTVGEGDDPGEWLTLAMTFRPQSLGWKLTEVVLPDRVFRRLGRDLRMELRSGG